MTEKIKVRPQITGTIQKKTETGYIKTATVALWKQNTTGNQPTHKGTIKMLGADQKTPTGEVRQIALWVKS